MSGNIAEVLDDLQKFAAGRGRADNFCYSKVYSPSSYIRCIDFSPWVGRRVITNDIFGLAVFQAQLSKDSSFGVSVDISLNGEGKFEIDDGEAEDHSANSFDEEVNRHKREITRILQFPFGKHFAGDFKAAEADIITSWILGFHGEQFSRILMAHDLRLSNANLYFQRHNDRKKTLTKILPSPPNTAKLEEFRKEFRKLPLSSRLHLFDVLTYSGYKTKKPKVRPISDMTLYDTRKLGIDEFESANILSKNQLIVSLPDGKGYINPEFQDAVSAASEYAAAMSPAYREWESDVSDELSDFEDIDDNLDDRENE